MESKLNHQAIDSYSKAFTKKVAHSFFKENTHISGQQILSLCEFKQINLIILKNLFRKWKKENAKLQSPYFNYQSESVIKAMRDFMNALSKHIHIKREHFEPLFRDSVRDTLLLVFSPYDFYSKEINQRDDSRISLIDLHDLDKYIKVNEFLLEGLIHQFEKQKLKTAFNDEAFELFNEVCANSTDEPVEITPYLAELSKVIPLTVQDIYLDFEQTSEVISKANINEQFQTDEHKTLGGKLGKQNNLSIKKQLTLNQRFMFVNQLFEGNQQQFLQAVDQIDAFDNKQEADKYIQKTFIESYDWDLESEEVQEFLELVDKKFS
jgi:hypothetical protein